MAAKKNSNRDQLVSVISVGLQNLLNGIQPGPTRIIVSGFLEWLKREFGKPKPTIRP